MNIFQNAKVLGSNVDPTEYHKKTAPRGHRDYVMTRSELMAFYWNPQGWILGKDEDEGTSSTEFGQVVDCIVLSPKSFFQRIAITPETYTNKKGEQSAWRNDKRIAEVADWLDANEGKLIIKADVNGEAHAAAKRLESDTKIKALLDCSDTQVLVTAEYLDPVTKLVVPVKALLDLVPRPGSSFQKCLADLKTARNASLGAWGRVCFDEQYYVQAAFYTDLYEAATGEERTDWLHVIVENVHPYEPARRIMESSFVQLGRDQYRMALARYCRCLAAGYWPGYDEETDGWNGWSWTYMEPWMQARANAAAVDLTQPPEPPKPAPVEPNRVLMN